MATLWIGSLIGVAYFVLDLQSVGRAVLGTAAAPQFAGLVTDSTQGLGIPFMLAGPILTAACTILYVATSLLTPAMDPAEVAKVCWDHPLAFLRGRITGAGDPRVVALVLLAVICTLYYWLR